MYFLVANVFSSKCAFFSLLFVSPHLSMCESKRNNIQLIRFGFNAEKSSLFPILPLIIRPNNIFGGENINIRANTGAARSRLNETFQNVIIVNEHADVYVLAGFDATNKQKIYIILEFKRKTTTTKGHQAVNYPFREKMDFLSASRQQLPQKRSKHFDREN